MNTMTQTQRDFLAADLNAVKALIERLTPSDFVSRIGLESRREELEASLASAEVVSRPLASAVLYFGGAPVSGSEGIESEFGAEVISRFQDIVSKVSAARRFGPLHQTGPVTDKEGSKLHITNVLRGSFGFQFEELESQMDLFGGDTFLKESVDEAVRLMISFDETEGDSLTDDAIEDFDTRIRDSVTEFFDLIYEGKAVFRVIAGGVDKTYNRELLERARERVQQTTVDEVETWFDGRLAGILPVKAYRFEYQTATQGLISGKIDRELAEDLPKLRNLEDKDSRAKMKVKRVVRPGKPPRAAYLLQNIFPKSD